MATFPTNIGVAVSNVFPTLVQLAATVRAIALQLSSDSAAGPVPITRVVNAVDSFATAYERINTLKATPGLADRVRAEYGNQALDAAAGLNDMQAAILDFVVTTIPLVPKDGTGKVLERSFDAQGHFVLATATTQQMAQVRAKLDAILETTTA